MNTQMEYRRRPYRLLLLLTLTSLAAVVVTGTAVAGRSISRRSDVHCGAGSTVVAKMIHTGGRKKRVFVCRQTAAAPASPAPAPAAPASSTPPSVPSAPSPVVEIPAVQAPPPAVAPIESPPVSTPPVSVPPGEETTTENPPATGSGTQVKAAIAPGFHQNPLAPDEVTWRYSASATRTVTTNGVPTTEPAPLPRGRLVLFVDGALDCEIQAEGPIDGSACTVVLKSLGAHEVKAIYAGATSSTATRTDMIGKYPTATSLQVSVEPTPPEYVDIGTNKWGYDAHAFEVGRLRITGATTPTGYPVFTCAGQTDNCLEPEVGLWGNRGSVSVPLYALWRTNMVTGVSEWKVGFEAYSLGTNEENRHWQFPTESAGKRFYHAVSNPDPDLYVPSSITVPLDLNGGHYPYYRWLSGEKNEMGGSVAAVEGVPRKVVTLGTYDKLGGSEENLSYHGEFYSVYEESVGCAYEIKVDGKSVERGSWEPNESRVLRLGDGVLDAPPGPHTFDLWVERREGKGPGNCALQGGSFEAYEAHRHL